MQSTANWYRSRIDEQLAVPTDVTVDVHAVESGDRQYDVTTTLTLDEEAAARNVRLTLVETIDNWPTVDDYWRNTHRRTITDAFQVSLQPGASQSFTETVMFGAESWNNFENIKMVAFAEGDAGVLNAGKYLISTPVQNTIDADFNDDGEFDVRDADLLTAEILNGSNNSNYDLTENGMVDTTDLDEWLSRAAAENGYAEPFRRGDANLDGEVNAVDLNAVGVNWFADSGAWSKGDFVVDGRTDAEDLNILGINWQLEIAPASPVANTVPEPGGHSLLLGLMFLSRWRKR